MDQHSLLAFIAVAEQASFSLAAEQLHLTQPAVSKRISTLEEQLGSKLFDRIGRHTTLTEPGEALLPRARNILLEMEDARRAMSNLNTEVSGILNTGTSHHIGLHRLPPYLKKYTSAYPQVKLNLKFIDSEQAYDKVLQGELELGIVTLPPKAEGSLRSFTIWPDPLDFVIAPNHPLTKKKNLSLAELVKYPAVLPSANTFTRQIAEELFKAQQLEIDTVVSTNYLETLKMMVEVGLGWSILPRTMVDKSIKTLKLRNLALERNLGCVYHPKRSLSNAAKCLINCLQQKL